MGKICSRPEEKPENPEPELRIKKEYKTRTIEILFGDITRIQADGIVSSGNYELSNNSGLALSISHRGGVEIHKECQQILEKNGGQVQIGDAYITTGGQLKAKHVIHVICPMYTGGQHREAELLGNGINNALVKADEFGLVSIAIPSVATGLFGFPKEICADIIVKKTIEYIDNNPNSVVKNIKLINHDNPTCVAFEKALEKFMPPPLEGETAQNQPAQPQSNGPTQENQSKPANQGSQEVPAEMTKSKYPDL